MPITSRLLVLLAALLSAGCSDTAFEPFVETERAFSLFGYLDPAADTQFVRLTPLRHTPDVPADLGATLTLEEVGTGRTVIFRDSLFHYAGGRRAHNFWTTAPIFTSRTYRLTATAADGATSTVQVRTPDPFLGPVLEVGFVPWGDYWSQSILVDGADRFAAFDVIYDLTEPIIPGGSRRVVLPYRDRVMPLAGRLGVGGRFYDELARHVGFCPEVERVEVVIAVAGPDWPELEGVDLETLAIPTRYSNVENGLGYVGALFSRRIEWREVLIAFAIDRQKYCPLER